MSKSKSETLTIGRHKVPVTNLDKVLYPKTGFTKGQVIEYYIAVSEFILPHLKDRPLTLKRYPNGVDKPFFYEKNSPEHRPDWVKTGKVWSDTNDDYIHYTLVNNPETLVWVANLASLELHPTLGRWRTFENPTAVVFDLDPGPPATIVECCRVGLVLRGILGELKLNCYAKTSGSKGLQIYVPLNRKTTSDKARAFALAVARHLQKALPGEVVTDMKKTLRKGKILVDWSQNSASKTTVSVYSLRAKETPTVSTPVTWDEVTACAKKKKATMLVFDSATTLKRLQKHGDLFKPLLTEKQKLPYLDPP